MGTTRRTIKYYWDGTKRYKVAVATIVPLIIFSVATNDMGTSYVLSLIIDKLSKFTQGSSATELWLLFGVFIALIVVGNIGWRITARIYIRQSAKTLRDLENMMFQRLMKHSYKFFTNRFSGSIVTQFNRFLRSYENLEDIVTFEIFEMSLRIIFSVVILMFVAPWIAWALVVWTVLFVLSIGWLAYKKMPISKESAAADSRVTGDVADSVTNVLTIKMFAHSGFEHKRFKNTSDRRFRIRIRSWMFDEYIRALQAFLMIIFQIVVIYFSIRFVVDGTMSVGVVLLAQLYIGRIYNDLWNLQNIIRRVETSLSEAAEMTEILELPIEVADSKSPEEAKFSEGKIEFKDVTFKYGKRDKLVFDKFNLTIKPGERVGLVGHSGGGKTTLTKLLLRFADVADGEVLIDGQNIANIRQEDLRANIAYVPQEPILFHRSLMENIRYGRLDATDREVHEAARKAHAADFIDELPEGYETLVGERGLKLSGGQKQRVAIARAMLSKAPILLLDEATSSLDSKSEKLIAEGLSALMEKRTTIVIAHRLSTIRRLDRILVLHNGDVTEQGTHDKLLKEKNGVYAELWGHQSGDFM